MRVYYCDHYEIPLPPGHKFPMRKYRMLREALEGEPFLELLETPLAEPEEIERVHDPAYVAAFLEGSLTAQAQRRIGFPWSSGLVDRTLASVGGTLQAGRDALDFGTAGVLAGGTHHAFRDEGSGFCVFNDIAVAIETLRYEGLINRAAVVDLDVHQGDGTASIFEGDRDVFTFSMHGANNFPFRKQLSSLDVELPDQTEDPEFLRLLHEHLPRIWEFAPDIVFFQAGVDGLKTDKLGRLALTHEGLAERDRIVLEGALRHNLPLVATLGGGYSDPIEATVLAHRNTFMTLATGSANSR